MANRREFIQSGLIASAALAGALPSVATSAALPRLERFVFDRRFEPAVQAARLAAARGVPLAPTDGDVTSLWYRDLDLRWRERPMALAGITTRGALFVLETLAADRGMRVLYRAEHGVDASGLTRSETIAGPAEAFAALLPPSLASGASADGRGEALYSWIIAPRGAVAATV